MKLSEATRLVATLRAAFPRTEFGEETLEVYARDLADLDADVADQAVTRLRRTSRFFPTIGEIRETAALLTLSAPTPAAGYGQVLEWVTRRRTFQQLHPLVCDAVRMVGDTATWRAEPAWQLRRLFLDTYRELRTEAVAELAAPAVSLPAAVPHSGVERPSAVN